MRTPVFRVAGLVAAQLLLFSGVWQVEGAPVNYLTITPLVVQLGGNENVTVSIQTDPVVTSARIRLVDGTLVPMIAGGNGIYSGVLTHRQAVSGYSAAQFNHLPVGFLETFQGSTMQTFNLVLNIADGLVPGAAIQNVNSQVQKGSHIVNLVLPAMNPSAPDINAIAVRFYQNFGDNYDFLNIVTVPDRFENRYHSALRNNVQGIGLGITASGVYFGSAARLAGYSVFPIASLFDLAETGAVHELGHQFIDYLAPKIAAFQGVTPHWPVSSMMRGIMGYQCCNNPQGLTFSFDFVSLGGGSYRLVAAEGATAFNDMELYLMGLLPADQVGPQFIFANQNQNICNGCTLTGAAPFSAADIVAAYGPRVPAFGAAPNKFRAATIIASQRMLTENELAFFDYMAARGSMTTTLGSSGGLVTGTTRPFYLATGKRACLITTIDLGGECPVFPAGAPRGALDFPVDGATVSGPVALGGWAAVVSGNTAGLASRVELWVDGGLSKSLNQGVLRLDVQQFFAAQGLLASNILGFFGNWDSTSVRDGTHRLSIRAVDTAGIAAEAAVEIAAVSLVTNNGIAPTTTTTTTVRTTTTTTTGSTTTTTIAAVSLRYFPKIVNSSLQTTGLAVVNLSNDAADLNFRAYSNSGGSLGAVSRRLPAGQQLAQLIGELLPGMNAAEGWLSLESSVPVEGFFLLFDPALTFMDGAAVSGGLLQEFVLPGVDYAEINVVNPSAASSATYHLEFVSDTGSVRNFLDGTIPGNGRIAVPSSSLKPVGDSGYIHGIGRGVVALEIFSNSTQTWLAALPATNSAAGVPISSTQYAPQFVVGGGFNSELDFINLEAAPLALTLTLIGDTGQALGSAGLNMAASGSARIAAAAFGIGASAALTEGYVRIQSNGGRFTGAVRFTDADGTQFGSALSFVASGQTQTFFSQVAADDLFFTGLAAINIGSQTATASITVFDPLGAVVGTGQRQIPPGGRFSKLLTELTGPLPPMSKGYFRLTGTQPLASFALFGTNNGEVLAAIPPQVR